MIASLTAVDSRSEAITQHTRAIHANIIALSLEAAALYQTTPAYDELQDKLVQSNSLLTEEEAAFRQAQAAAAEANTSLYERIAAEEATAEASEAAAEATRLEAEALAALTVKMGDYFVEAMNVDSATRMFSESTGAVVTNTQSVSAEMFNLVGASDAGAFSVAAVGLALGQFSPQAAEAYLKTAILKIEMDKLAASFAETGNVNALVTGMQDAMASVEGLSMTINSADGSVHMIDASMGTVTQSTQAMIDKFGEVPSLIDTEVVLDSAAAVDSFITYKGYLDGIPDTVTTNVVTNYTNTGSTSPGTANASGGYQQMSTGGEVTGGTPGRDSVPAMLMPGERVLTPNQNQEWKQWKSGRDQSRGDMLANNLFGGGGSGSSSVVSNAAANGNVTIQIINYNQFSGPVSQDTLAKFESNQRRAIEQALDERDRRVSGMTRMRS